MVTEQGEAMNKKHSLFKRPQRKILRHALEEAESKGIMAGEFLDTLQELGKEYPHRAPRVLISLGFMYFSHRWN